VSLKRKSSSKATSGRVTRFGWSPGLSPVHVSDILEAQSSLLLTDACEAITE